MIKKIPFTIYLLLLNITVFSQSTETKYQRCSSIDYETYLKNNNSNRKSITEFEKWLQPLIAEEKQARSKSRNASNSVIKIPVVIHIIHNGDAVGVGENISTEQALSQIEVLNNDFRKKLGTPGHNTHPAGADLEIEFVMAKRKPDGTATNGIDRVQVSNAQFTSMANVETMKQSTVWDTSKYMNMWTVRIGGGTSQWNGTLGYAQFPSYSGISGMSYNNPTTEALTDGLVMRHDAFGSREIWPTGTYGGTKYDKGRTATHEIGHWAGLRHIWGDASCGNDFCADTPTAHDANYGCPSVVDCNGSGNEMVENYMDYTDDSCMNIFTLDQKNRIMTVFKNADRRNTLLYSDALVPVGLSLEAGITLEKDGVNNCSAVLSPILKLKNYGTTPITSAEITYSLDGSNTQTYNYSGNIAAGASTNINLNNLTFTSDNQSFYSNITKINGASNDGFADNNSLQKTVYKPKATTSNNLTLKLQLDRYGSEVSWELRNSSAAIINSGNGYTDSSTLPALLNIPFNNLASNECYTFTMNDSADDGLGNGGYFEIVDSNNNIIASGGSFKTTSQHKFSILTLSKADFEFTDLKMYPNPNNGKFNIEFNPESSENININVYDISGREISSKEYKTSGLFNESIDLQNVKSGVYLVSISDGIKKTVKRIIIE